MRDELVSVCGGGGGVCVKDDNLFFKIIFRENKIWHFM